MTLRSLAHAACAGFLCVLAAAGIASAQRADTPAPAGPRTIVGVVRDAESRPLEDVEIRIGASNRSVRSGRNGSFRFDSIPAGKHDLRARRLGYEPQTRTVTVKEQGGVVVFSLKAIPQSLTTVVTAVSRGGLSGIVTDSLLRPLPGAAVRVFGGDARTVTDSAGEFYMDVRPGSFMVQVASPRHRTRLVSVTVPKDSGRRMAIGLQRGKAASARDQIAMREFAHRLAWRVSPAVFFSRERLDNVPNKRLTALVRSVNLTPYDESLCTAVVNGGPESAPLWYFDADEIEGLEVYPRGGRERQGGGARACPVVFVWLR
jgi:hypothetical protein